ncbi:MAG: hypothetical protein GEU99_13605 [Luteitalea sp.]|nr:hypothetical protein [Luteitalea sp.]
MVICAGCGNERAQPVSAQSGRFRMPAGWKRLEGRLWCPACKRRRFVLRAIALPVSGPSDATWPELRAALHEAFGETTRCANWLVTELYARDRHRQRGDGHLPKMRGSYLYPEARSLFPALASQTLASLERQVRAKYRAARLDLVWRHAVSLPTYRYPTPLPMPSRMWDLVLHGQRWHLSVRIGDRRWLLRLRQGPGMWRQIRVLQQVAAGTVEAGEATLYEIRARRGDHRSDGTRERRLMVKLAVWLARREAREARDTLIVRTAPHAFVTAQIAGQDHVWTLNADHVRRWIAETTRRQQRLREDVEVDCRHPASERSDLAVIQRRLSAQLRRRLHSWTHQATAQLIACAQRRRVATIAWEDTDRGYVPSYPWHQFVTTLTDKAAAVGISVMTQRPAGDQAASASPDALTEDDTREGA